MHGWTFVHRASLIPAKLYISSCLHCTSGRSLTIPHAVNACSDGGNILVHHRSPTLHTSKNILARDGLLHRLVILTLQQQQKQQQHNYSRYVRTVCSISKVATSPARLCTYTVHTGTYMYIRSARAHTHARTHTHMFIPYIEAMNSAVAGQEDSYQPPSLRGRRPRLASGQTKHPLHSLGWQLSCSALRQSTR